VHLNGKFFTSITSTHDEPATTATAKTGLDNDQWTRVRPSSAPIDYRQAGHNLVLNQTLLTGTCTFACAQPSWKYFSLHFIIKREEKTNFQE
jgi:hypothetical protein